MSVRKTLMAALATAFIAAPALAGGIMIEDAYARSSGPTAKTGAAFFIIRNDTDQDDRLIDARSDVAKKTELHTHIHGENGVMQMRRDEDGFPVPAHGTHQLKRGGDHVMLMGLKKPLKDGEIVPIVLVFEKAGEVAIEVPVDLERMPEGGAMGGMKMNGMNMGSGGMKMGN